jgi:O-antigen/teichoic acid export membrane protein
MGPLGFLTGVVLGSATSIALVLALLVVIFALTAGGSPEVSREYPDLLASAGLFAALAAVAAAAFVGLQRHRPWRWAAQAAMWLALALVAWHYWPVAG